MVRHILSDGRQLDDISGFIIKRNNKEIYQMIERCGIYDKRRVDAECETPAKEKLSS